LLKFDRTPKKVVENNDYLHKYYTAMCLCLCSGLGDSWTSQHGDVERVAVLAVAVEELAATEAPARRHGAPDYLPDALRRRAAAAANGGPGRLRLRADDSRQFPAVSVSSQSDVPFPAEQQRDRRGVAR